MLQYSYSQLSKAEKIGLLEVAQNKILASLIASEIISARTELCTLTPGNGMDLHYAIIQQRLISLENLADFFETIEKDVTPHLKTE